MGNFNPMVDGDLLKVRVVVVGNMPSLLASDSSKCFKIINPLNPYSDLVMRELLPSPVSW